MSFSSLQLFCDTQKYFLIFLAYLHLYCQCILVYQSLYETNCREILYLIHAAHDEHGISLLLTTNEKGTLNCAPNDKYNGAAGIPCTCFAA